MTPKLFPPHDETLAGAAEAIRTGRKSCRDVLEACLDRIDEFEPKVRAWVVVTREAAQKEADLLDQELHAGHWRGPLHGIPIGVKDIVDVAGLATAGGAFRWTDQVAEADAPVVADLRRRGALILGKTVTTPYAWIDPPPTRNPWNLDRTPGGSSSGSAAALACGMCLGAIGSQTGGSITRPAAYCGIAGYKPAHGGISTEGVLPLAPTLDHVGFLARTVCDLALLLNVEFRFVPHWQSLLTAPDRIARRRPALPGESPRLGRLRGLFDDRAEPSVRKAFDHALSVLAENGAAVNEPEPAPFVNVHKHHYTIMATEAAVVHEASLAAHPEDYPPRIRRLIEDGLAVRGVDYARSWNHCRLARDSFGMPNDLRNLVTPAAPGPAPNPSTTGDPVFNSPWSYLGLPTISLPMGFSPDGLPLGLQLIGTNADPLFADALWCEAILRRSGLES